MELIINPRFKSLLPRLTAEELAMLERSLIADGCRDPLHVWNRTIVDGHNRYEICTRLNIPFEIRQVEFENEDAAMDWIDTNQLGRRNLTPDAFRLALGRHYNRVKRQGARTDLTSGQNDPKLTTAAQLAGEYGVSEKTVKRAGLFAKEVEKSPELQEAIINNVPITKIKREERRQERVEIITNKTDALDTVGKFNVIYADPPWKYEYSVSTSREIENQYPTMDIDDICKLSVGNISADDCVLFIWATSPKLKEALRVLEAWGFEYKTCMVWIKDKIGMGYYARQQHELLLIGARGSLPTPLPENRPASIVYAPRDEHSKKPDDFYSIIEKMYPEFTKVELFSRNKREGWYSWGNQL